MSVLSDRDIRGERERGRLKIEPFQDSLLQPASYDLRIGRVLLPHRGIVDPAEVGITLRPSEWAEIETLEKIELPDDMVAMFGIRSSIARRGIVSFGGPQVDPGYQGRLFVGLFNPSSEGLALSTQEAFLTIQFVRLEHPASAPYHGEYQGMDRFPEADVLRMMGAQGPTLADVVHSVGLLEGAVDSLKASVNSLGEEMKQTRGETAWTKRAAFGILIALVAGWILQFVVHP